MKSISLLFMTLFILSVESIAINESPQELKANAEESFNIRELANYTLDISQFNDEKYIHLEVLGSNKDTIYVLSVVDAFDKQNRIQLGQCVVGNTDLILSKQQINGNIINIVLECSDYTYCSGTIKNKILNKIPLTENKPFNYYNTIDNMIMEFNLTSTSELLNIWARGELEMTTNLEGAKFTENKDHHLYIVNNTDSKEITFKVTGKKGDYINIGFTGYNQKNVHYSEKRYLLSSQMIKDGYTLTAYLNGNMTEKYCYTYDNSTEGDEGIYASGISFISNAGIELYGDDKGSQSSNIKNTIRITKLEEFQFICFQLEKESNESIYIFQIYSNKSLENKVNILEPQYNGLFYSYNLKPGSKMAVISQGAQLSDKNILYYLISPYQAKLYALECDNYPLCSLDDSKFNENLSSIMINWISALYLEKDQTFDFSPINKHQKLYAVKCDENSKKNCEIESLINRDNKEINLQITDLIAKKILTGQTDKYKIDTSFLNIIPNISSLIVEISVFAGVVDISTDFPKEVEYNKINHINKISLLINNIHNNMENLYFSVKSLENSYYNIFMLPRITVNFFSYHNSYITYGFPRLYSFPKEDNLTQIIPLIDLGRHFNISTNINFNSLNCEIEVKDSMNNIILKKNGHYFHSSPNIKENKDYFEINIINEDISEYNNKMCYIYMNYKDTMINDTNGNYLDFLVIDNIPQQIMFNEELRHVSYGYFLGKLENDVIIKYSSKNKAKYIAKIYYSGHQREKEDSAIMGDGIIYLNYEEWENICKDRDCFIQLDITLDRVNFAEDPEPILEITIKSLEAKKVTYIPKHEIIKDYIHYQLSQYYYTEIGKNEIGYINIHFLKGSGKAVAKIVEEDKTEPNPDWKRKYVLPTKDNSDLKMDTFTKKLKFSTEKYNCQNKCYLIINVFSDINADKLPMKRIYPFTIHVQSYPNNFKFNALPIISAQIDEYVTGSLDKGKEKDVYDFYQMQLNDEKEYIIIDIHSNIERILVNIGDSRPTNETYNYNFEITDHDNIFNISKAKIKADLKIENLKGLTLSLALYSSKFNDTILSIPYSFIVRLSDESEKDIYRINSEQQALRKTKPSQGDRALNLFLIEYDYLSDFFSLMIYARDTQHPNNKLDIKGKYVDYEDYLFNNIDLTQFNISNSEMGENYIYLEKGFIDNEKPRAVLISIGISAETIIQFYTMYDTNYNGAYLDASAPGIKYVPKNQSLTLTASILFPTSLYFKCLGGKGEIYYEGGKHHNLNEYDNNLTLNFNNKEKESVKLTINENDEVYNSTGFVFLLEQYLNSNIPPEDQGKKDEDSSKTDGKNGDEGMDKTTRTIIIVCSVVGFVIIVGVIVAIVWYKKNKNLGKDIYKISFEKDRDKNNDDLLMNEEN